MTGQDDEPKGKAFATLARKERNSLWLDLRSYLRESKKYWLLPILVTFLLVGALFALSGTAVAPFIYTLF